jgi:Ni/Co efflux regulator RcnB
MVQDMMKSNIHPMAAASSDDENKDMARTNDQDDSSVVSPARWSRGRRGGRRIKQKREATTRARKTGNSTMMLVFVDHPFQTCPFGNEVVKLPEFGSAMMDADSMKVRQCPGKFQQPSLRER